MFTEFLKRNKAIFVAIYFSWFAVPLVLASICRPFALWDYLTSENLFHGGYPVTWVDVIPNCLRNLWTATFIVRPTVCMLLDLQTLIFGGEFWMWYALKWAAKCITILMVVWALRHYQCRWATQVSLIAILAFHHASFTLMLFAPDGWVALGALAQLLLLMPVEGDLRKLSRTKYLAFVLLGLFTIGAKEVAYAFQACLVVFLLMLHPASWRLLTPNIGILTFWTWRLSEASGRAAGFVFTQFLHRFFGHGTFLVPGSPLYLLHILFILGSVISLKLAWTWRRLYKGRLIAFCWIAATAMLVFVSIPSGGALRYVLPTFYLLSFPFGMALESLGKTRLWFATFLIVVYPLLTAGTNYQQELAYQYQFFEVHEAYRLMYSEARAGAELVLTGLDGDVTGEPLYTTQRFFGEIGPRWYAFDHPRQVWMANTRQWPDTRFVVFSRFPPKELLARTGETVSSRLENALAMVPGDHGVLEGLTRAYLKLDSAIGRRGIYAYDLGAPQLSREPELFLYTFRSVGPASQVAPRTQPSGRLPGAL